MSCHFHILLFTVVVNIYLIQKNGDELVTLDVTSNGQLFAKCQATDYHCWGKSLSNYNVLDFFVNTYKADIDAVDHRAAAEFDDGNDDLQCRRGRPRNDLTSIPPCRTTGLRILVSTCQYGVRFSGFTNRTDDLRRVLHCCNLEGTDVNI